MTLTRIVAGLALAVAIPNAALAGEWQYCLAPSHDEHKVYVSAAFPSVGAGNADISFDNILSRTGLRHDSVQCPRADDESAIMAMIQYAVVYNKQAGNEIIYINWEPAS